LFRFRLRGRGWPRFSGRLRYAGIATGESDAVRLRAGSTAHRQPGHGREQRQRHETAGHVGISYRQARPDGWGHALDTDSAPPNDREESRCFIVRTAGNALIEQRCWREESASDVPLAPVVTNAPRATLTPCASERAWRRLPLAGASG